MNPVKWGIAAILAILAIVVPLSPVHSSHPASGGVPGNFVYICTETDTAKCQFGEVFATYDNQGDPLLTVSPYGNIASYGLAYSITPLGDVFHRLMSMGPMTPNTYQKVLNFGTGCHDPEWWIGPNDDASQLQIWHCVNGAWRLYKTL